jgi:UDP-2,3-diacylglucosamine hydrolase
VVPKGFIRLLGKLAELTDSGIKVHMFTGNHDMWMFGYFEDELNITVYKEQMDFIIQNKKFHIGHGDGLGPGDWSYKFLKKIFKSKICQKLFAFAHPDLGLSIANYFSNRSRLSSGSYETEHHPESKEYLIQYVKSHAKNYDVDFYVFGHRHIPLKLPLENNNAIYINLGEWVHYYSYAVFDGNQIELKKFE